MARRGLGMVLAVVTVAAAASWAFAGFGDSATATPTKPRVGSSRNWAVYRGAAFTFRYPSGWHRRNDEFSTSMSESLVEVSPQRDLPVMRCPRHRYTGGFGGDCNETPWRLGRDSVLVQWSMGGGSIPLGGRSIRVGGLRATWMVRPMAAGEGRLNFGATELVAAVVTSRAGSTYELDAYVRGPDAKPLVQQVRVLLLTFRLRHGDG